LHGFLGASTHKTFGINANVELLKVITFLVLYFVLDTFFTIRACTYTLGSEGKVPMSKKEMTVTEFAALGGRARAKSMTAKQRKASAQKAIAARWKKNKKGGIKK
jgi:hypothetical protein